MNTRPDHRISSKIEVEQKVGMLSIELAHDRIREIERAAYRYRRPESRRAERVRPLRRLLLILR